MEDKNIKINLFIKQLNQSNALGYNPAYIASTADYNFAILDRAYENTGKVYAELKTALIITNVSNLVVSMKQID